MCGIYVEKVVTNAVIFLKNVKTIVIFEYNM